jgi:formate-dependent nitrite reductase membrane component NrfD
VRKAAAVPDTFFTASPHWEWYIILYFFIGGIAGGCFLLAALLQVFGRPEDRPVARLGYYAALVGAGASGLVLTLDLTRPERFWHMLLQSHTGLPMFKAWSPMSVGAWGLLGFGGFAFLATLAVLGEEGLSWSVLRRGPVRWLAQTGPATAIAALGSLFGLFLAGYTGVLLAVTNRPIWADSSFLGLLFLLSAGSTAAACLMLLATWRRRGDSETLETLARFDRRMLLFELIALALFVGSLGPVARVLAGWWGALLLVGVVGVGIVLPLALEHRGGGRARLARASALVLAGGLLLRTVVILSSDAIHVTGTSVVR